MKKTISSIVFRMNERDYSVRAIASAFAALSPNLEFKSKLNDSDIVEFSLSLEREDLIVRASGKVGFGHTIICADIHKDKHLIQICEDWPTKKSEKSIVDFINENIL